MPLLTDHNSVYFTGRKRAATDDTAGTEKRETRSSKVQKTEGGGRGRGGAKGTARLKVRRFHLLVFPLIFFDFGRYA